MEVNGRGLRTALHLNRLLLRVMVMNLIFDMPYFLLLYCDRKYQSSLQLYRGASRAKTTGDLEQLEKKSCLTLIVLFELVVSYLGETQLKFYCLFGPLVNFFSDHVCVLCGGSTMQRTLL